MDFLQTISEGLPSFNKYCSSLDKNLILNLFIYNRKKSLMLNNILGLAGGVLMGLSKPAKSYEMIIIGRFIIGLNCGKKNNLND